MRKTAGIVIIGNEILSGTVRDRNAVFMARELQLRGIKLCQISVVPDDVDEIARVVKEFSKRFHYVFTSGGLGPTHDDVTIEGISKAFGVQPVVNEGLKKLLHERFGETLSTEKLKIARIPRGAELIFDKALKFPLIRFSNIYIYPGVTKILEKQFFITSQHLDGRQAFLVRIYIDERESEMAPFLNKIIRGNIGINIGSYTVMEKDHFLILLTLESSSEKILNAMLAKLIHEFPKEKIMRVDYFDSLKFEQLMARKRL